MKTSSRFHRFVAFAFAALFAAASANAADTVLAHWPFTNGSLEDTSGNNHTIEVGEAVVTSGGCLSFPANAAEGTSWAQTTDAITMSGSKNATVSLWFRQPTSTANASFLELSANPTGNVGAFRLGWLESRKVVVDYRATSGVNTRESTADRYDDNEWHQVVATMFIGGKNSNPTVTLYVDGKVDSTSTASAKTKNYNGGDTFTNDKFYFARRAGSEGTGGSFAGDIGEVAVYGEVLSAACMQTNYYRELGRVYKGDSTKYQSRLPDGWRVDAQGVFSYRVRVISDRGISLGGDVRSAGTNEFWFVENEINTLTVTAAASGERIAWSSVPTTATFDAKGEAASFAVMEPLEMSVSSFTPTHVWTGAASTDFKADGNWADASGAETNAPVSDARVFIPVGVPNQPTASAAIFVGELRIGSLTNGTQKATFTSSTTAAHQIAGDMVVYACGVMTHSTGTKIYVSCGRNMSIEKNGAVEADGKGNATDGRIGKNQSCASYGGRGGMTFSGLCYGNIREPSNLGSLGGGSGGKGGGAIRLTVAGILRVDGRIGSNGTYSSNGGSGGSVWLTTGSLVGAGLITALESTKNGGGGRIAIYQTATADRTFAGVINVDNGTLYREDLGDAQGVGELILMGTDSRVTEIGTAIVGSERPFKKITFENAGQTLIIMDNIHVTVCGDIVANGNTIKADYTTLNGSSSGSGNMGSIDLLGATAGTTRLSGTFTLGAFTCTNGAETIEVAKGTKLTLRNDGILKLNGSAEKLMTMFSPEPSWSVTLGDNVDTAVKCVAVSNSTASSVISDIGGLDLGGNENWTFPSMPKLDEPITWVGTNGTAWGSAENWVDKDGGNRLPIETDRVVINAGCQDYPTLSASGGAAFHALQIAAGARLTIADTVVSASGDVTCAGRLELTGTTALSVGGDVKLSPNSLTMGLLTSLTLTGADAQLADFGGNRLNRLRVASPSVTFTNGFAAVSFTCEQPQRAVALRFSAGDTYAADSLRLTPGADGSLTLDSTTDGSCWNLIAGPGAACDGVSVKDCDARGGYEIVVSAYADRGNNQNWRVGAVSAWTGANGTAWDESGNWTGGVPTETSDVRILPTATGNMPTLAGATSVRSLTVGDGSGILTLTLSKALTVSDFMRVNGGATVVANQPVVVSNDVYVAAGATLTHAVGSKLDLSCGGDMTIEKEGAVDVDRKGNSTKGRTNNNQSRTSYGGLGGLGLQCYGSIRQPNDLGSRGTYDSTMAGGAVRLTVAGTLCVEGRVSSNGRCSGTESSDGAGSGGSVWLTVGSLIGSGSITAWEEARLAGGGRIAIYQTATATRTAFTGTIYVDNGTLYREDLGDAPGVGELILQGTRVVELSTQVVGSSEPFKKITFEGAGQTMIIMDNIPVTVCGDILASGNAILADRSNGKGTGNMGTIDVLGAAEGVTHVSGNITVGGFTCTNGTAALEFAAGKTLTVRDNGTLWLEGRDRQKLELKSSVPGEYWFINAGTNLTGRTRFLNVSDSNAHGGEKITARSSVGKRAHNDNWAFPGGIALIIK